MQIQHPEIGICGLSCRLCPSYHIVGKSKCNGCKSDFRMSAGCPFITCAVKRKGIEFCWLCDEGDNCTKWQAHREYSREFDTFVCYQKLEDNITFIRQHGLDAFDQTQHIREQMLREMLHNFNEGRSKRYFSIAVTVLEIDELQSALTQANKLSIGVEIKEKSRLLHGLLDEIADERGYVLRLRKYKT
jgi:hypothetical protein